MVCWDSLISTSRSKDIFHKSVRVAQGHKMLALLFTVIRNIQNQHVKYKINSINVDPSELYEALFIITERMAVY